jgi:hypothetical protein
VAALTASPSEADREAATPTDLDPAKDANDGEPRRASPEAAEP